MGDEKETWEIVAALSISRRLPIATFIDGFNTVFHLGLFGAGERWPLLFRSEMAAEARHHLVLWGCQRERETDLLWVSLGDLFPSWEVVSCFIGRRWG